MAYDLGIDVGTSYSAAAIRRPGGVIEVAGLGTIADSVPTVVYLDDDGTMIVGDAANRRSVIDPTGSAREFKRRMGDPTPLILGSSPFSAESLMAKVMRYIVDKVAEREHEPPRHVTITHPANWGPYKLELFDQAFRLAGLEGATALSEPAAAAHSYAAEARVPVGSLLAVYDLGGGTFDAAVLRKEAERFDLLGESIGIEHLGGVDFDEAIFHQVRTSVGDVWPDDPEDPELQAPMLHLRRSCMEAKELLSSELSAQIPVMVPGIDTTVAIERAQLETMIAPRVGETISALEAALGTAGVTPSDLHAVLLVGGSSRIPLVATMLRERLGDLVATDVDPLYAVARGAAVMAGIRGDEAAPAPATDLPGQPAPAPAPVAPLDFDQRAADPVLPVAPVATRPAAPAPLAPAAQAPVPVSAPVPEPVAAAPLAPPVVALPRTEPAVTRPAPEPVAEVRQAIPELAPRGPDPTFPPGTSDRGADLGGVPRTARATPPSGDGSGGNRVKLVLVGVLVGVVALAAILGFGLLSRDDPATDVGTADADAGEETGTETEGDPSPEGADGGPLAFASSEGMVAIAAGSFPLGVDKPEPNNAESLARSVDLPGFFIDQNEVTHEQYKAFTDQRGALAPLSWPGDRFPADLAAHPVRGVSFDWAATYCGALGKRLPSEAEWEAAARGPEGLLYPWGDDSSAVTIPESGTYEVGSVSGNTSHYEVNDLVGNVWEWVADSYDERVDTKLRVLRGGENGFLRPAASRLPVDPERSSALTVAGFRCAADEAQVDDAVAPLEFAAIEPPSETMAQDSEPLAAGVLINDQFNDATSGWLERTTEAKRFGYHPNGFYHLELKSVDQEVFAPNPVALSGDPFQIRTSVFVDDANTEPGGTFSYGIAFNWGDDGRGLIFVVDPRQSQWLVCERHEDGTYTVLKQNSRQIPEFDDVALEVRGLGEGGYQFLIGGNIVYQPTIEGFDGSGAGLVMLSYGGESFTKGHAHYNFFELSEG